MTSLLTAASVASWVALAGSSAQSTAPLTIDQATAIADQNAFAIRLQESVVRSNRAAIDTYIANLLPSASISYSYTRAGQAQYQNFGSGPQLFSALDSQSATGTITIPFDLSGARHRQVQASVATKQGSDATLKSTQADTKLNVRTAFVTVLRNLAQVKVYEQSLKEANEQLDQAEKQFKAAELAKIDRDRYAAQVDTAKFNLVSAQNTLEQSNYAFNVALARPVETTVTLVDIESAATPNLDAQVLSQAALKQRPEVLAGTKNLESASLLRRAAEGALVPSMSLSIQQSRALGDIGFGGQRTSSSLGLSVSIPVFEGGAAHATVKEYRETEAQAKIRLEQTKLSVIQDVYNAISAVSTAKSNVENARHQVQLNEEVFRLSEVKQKAGEGTYLDVIDAETTLTQARSNYVTARYNYLTAVYQLERAVGATSTRTNTAAKRGNK